MINSVLKVIRIMEVFSPEEPRLSLGEISHRLNMPKSTTHNLLNTLVSANYLEKVDGDHYAIGTAIIRLTQSVRVNVELRDRAAPLLRRLADSTGESVYLTVRDGDSVLYIYAIESSQRLNARTAVGIRAPLHCTSVGKAILAHLPPEDVRALYGTKPLPAFTDNTLTTLAALEVELERTRARGYAVDNQEHEWQVFCLGAPILDGRGHVVGACSLSGTDPDIVAARRATLAGDTTLAAREISRYMGFIPRRRSVPPAAPVPAGQRDT